MKMLVFFIVLLAALADATALETVNTEVTATRRGTTETSSANASRTAVSETDVLEARYWSITLQELQRARLLMRGPRGAFSDPRISPVEVLGVHARDEAERTRYAELFAKLLHDDTERVLAWQRAGSKAMARLYPNDKVIDFSTVDPTARGNVLPNWFFTPAEGAR